MKKKYRPYSGTNRATLERNIEDFKKELGERYIGKSLISMNPVYVFKVEYWEK